MVTARKKSCEREMKKDFARLELVILDSSIPSIWCISQLELRLENLQLSLAPKSFSTWKRKTDFARTDLKSVHSKGPNAVNLRQFSRPSGIVLSTTPTKDC